MGGGKASLQSIVNKIKKTVGAGFKHIDWTHDWRSPGKTKKKYFYDWKIEIYNSDKIKYMIKIMKL